MRDKISYNRTVSVDFRRDLSYFLQYRNFHNNYEHCPSLLTGEITYRPDQLFTFSFLKRTLPFYFFIFFFLAFVCPFFLSLFQSRSRANENQGLFIKRGRGARKKRTFSYDYYPSAPTTA